MSQFNRVVELLKRNNVVDTTDYDKDLRFQCVHLSIPFSVVNQDEGIEVLAYEPGVYAHLIDRLNVRYDIIRSNFSFTNDEIGKMSDGRIMGMFDRLANLVMTWDKIRKDMR